jgi:hypothetical protein
MLEAEDPGAFASGSVSGIRTRRYYALSLLATPPTGLYVLVNGAEAWLETSERTTSMLFIPTARPGSKRSQWTRVRSGLSRT